MTTLVDWQIVEAMEAEENALIIEPFDPNLLQGDSLDVRLGEQFCFPGEDGAAPMSGPLVLHRHDFVLASTVEYFEVPDNMIMKLEGKSSLGRQGLFVHITAGHIDGGFKGEVTLEILYVGYGLFTLQPGMRIGQMLFERTMTPSRSYDHPELDSHYQGQRGPTRARF